MRVLVLNAGSSSLKLSLVVDGEAIARRTDAWDAREAATDHRQEVVREALRALKHPAGSGAASQAPDAVGHRVVHGGDRFRAPVLVDPRVLDDLRHLEHLAPLHNPVAIDTIEAAREVLPDMPHVATFDTAFHATLRESAWRYPVPESWTAAGVRRYGFHGLSVEWAAGRAGAILERRVEDLRLVVAHLGSGCSVTAVDGGRSVSTSMGMTPLEGLMMGTRAGSIDPGILLERLRTSARSVEEVTEDLEHRSGLRGVAGRSDMAELETFRDAGDEQATLAIEMFVARAAAGIAAVATSLPRVDAIVFTGGIGEHATRVRAEIVERLGIIGAASIGADSDTSGDGRLNDPSATIAILRIEAREDLVIARHVQRRLDR